MANVPPPWASCRAGRPADPRWQRRILRARRRRSRDRGDAREVLSHFQPAWFTLLIRDQLDIPGVSVNIQVNGHWRFPKSVVEIAMSLLVKARCADVANPNRGLRVHAQGRRQVDGEITGAAADLNFIVFFRSATEIQIELASTHINVQFA